MISIVKKSNGNDFEWIDVTDPSEAELKEIAEKCQLHQSSVQDCLDPEHLPKFEDIDPVIFIIARIYDAEAIKEADTIQKLTDKIAIFIAEEYIITIHRTEQKFLEIIRERFVDKG